ncbi:MAG: hypothetical protein AAF466_11225 [Bacteroidota bacterium]
MKNKLFSYCLFGALLLAIVGCKSKQTNSEVTKTVLVQMVSDDAISQLETDFEAYQLQQEKVVSRPMKIYLFSFDEATITDKELVEQLKTSDLVSEAQTNKDVESRN